ncbi:MAG: TIGR03564 family F420-dependent LLM class oxidoreductase [Acidimicrobiia bacterium]|nr:TIGR03564 family F420-dependent LLM class oxidoreductase [Acidimicrobiia bacterium]
MRIGLSGGAASVEKMVEQATKAEADGFSALWYAGAIGGDPLLAMAMAGAATSTIELGTSIVQTYPCHPSLQANRVLAAVAAMDRPGFTLGIGPSHGPVIEGMYKMDYSHPGRHTEEYVRIISPLLRGEAVAFDGEDLSLHAAAKPKPPAHPVPLLVAALGPRLLRVAGELTDGTILWMGNARSIETHVAPRINAAAEAAGRPAPRIVAGLPVAVHDDVDEARRVAAEQFTVYGQLPNYRRLLDHGDADGPGDAAIVGDEAAVAAGIQGLFDSGATDVWAAVFPVGDDRSGSRARTNALLKDLVSR